MARRIVAAATGRGPVRSSRDRAVDLDAVGCRLAHYQVESPERLAAAHSFPARFDSRPFHRDADVVEAERCGLRDFTFDFGFGDLPVPGGVRVDAAVTGGGDALFRGRGSDGASDQASEHVERAEERG